MATAVQVFLEPAVQDIGIHSLTAGQCSDGSAGLLACGYQLGFEFGGVRPVGVLSRMSGNL